MENLRLSFLNSIDSNKVLNKSYIDFHNTLARKEDDSNRLRTDDATLAFRTDLAGWERRFTQPKIFNNNRCVRTCWLFSINLSRRVNKCHAEDC